VDLSLTNQPLMASFRANSDQLTKTQKRIAQYIVENPHAVLKLSISQLAKATGAKSEATIVRFYRQFGLAGYSDFKITLASELAENNQQSVEDISQKDNVSEITKKLLSISIRTFERNLVSIDYQAINDAVSILAGTNRLFCIGFALSSSVANMAYLQFSRLISSCYSLSDPHAAALLLADPRPKDTFLAISHSGASKDMVMLAEKFSGTGKIIALTSSSSSKLAQFSDCNLFYESVVTNYRTDQALSMMLRVAIIESIFIGLASHFGPETMKRLTKSSKYAASLKY